MKVNEGTIDRAARVFLGVGLLSLTQWRPQTAWGYIGLVPLITGIVGICPLYSVFGFNTCPISKK